MSSTVTTVIAACIAAGSVAGIVWLFRRGIRQYEQQRHAAAVPMDVSTTPSPVAPAERVVAVDPQGAVIVAREKELIDRITADPRDTDAYEQLGQMYLTQGNTADAAECFQQILVLAPENLRAVEQLKRIARMTAEQGARQ